MRKSKYIVAAIALILFAFPFISSNVYYLQIIKMVSINVILALGLNLIFGHTGQISIGQAGFYAIGAYVSAILEVKLGVPFIFAWVIAVLAAVATAGLIGRPILKLHGHYLAMATMAFGLIIEVLATNWLPVTGGHDGIYLPTKRIIGEFLDANLYFLVVISVCLLYVICDNIEFSRVGRAIRAVRENEMGAASIGIEHSKYKVIMFMLGAAFSAVAGILYAHMNKVITPEVFDIHASILILMMVVVGGLGSNVGVVVGAVFLTVLPEFLYGFAEYNILTYGLLVCLTLIFLPNGLYGLVSSLVKLIKNSAKDKQVVNQAEKG